MQELKQYPALRVEVTNAAIESLDKMREGSKKATLQLVDMECSYLTVDFFRKLPQDAEKGGNPTHSIFDRYNDSYLRRIGKVKSYPLYVIFWCGNLYIFYLTPFTSVNRIQCSVLRKHGLCWTAEFNPQVHRLLPSPRSQAQPPRPFLCRARYHGRKFSPAFFLSRV